MKYARVTNGTAVDVRTESPEGCFTPEVVAEFTSVPEEVENGWRLVGQTWAAPEVVEVVPQPEPEPVYPILSPPELKLLFTQAERLALRAARDSDVLVQDFFELVEDPRLTEINFKYTYFQEAINYFVQQNLITQERAAVILTGTLV